ncbi:MAG: diadenylate cyclase CdaA [Thermodesulfovibrionales bacterium]|nr:diadenylate cyclase CdaA [Thermodesulfovibrionales bacterium]
MIEIIDQLRWQDIVDIVLVSIIFYRILLIIKGTKAAKMLLGLGVLMIISFFSKYLELYTLDWIISSFWGQVVIVVIVIFQPEIRRALARMGESSIFQSLTPAEELKSLEEIIKAVISLSNKKIGALIVIEREVSIKDYVEIGVPLDAKVSKELLLSVFHPTSPIHDGAVVIKGNRVLAAGCFLPIALEADLSKSYGTRHRAGIGITEETDAVAIVVSEETGTISVGVDGKMESDFDIATLRDKLTELFTKPKKENNL